MPLEDWFDRMGGLTPIQGNLWRSPLPYTPQHFRVLRDAGIRIVYSMEEAVPGHLAQRAGLDWRPHFWTDDMPPTQPQIDAWLKDYLSVPEDVSVLVHCKAGWGRTGSAVTVALMVKNGWNARQALDYYWSKVPAARSIMTWNGQADFVHAYGASLAGRGLR